jgi:hypothetical protein
LLSDALLAMPEQLAALRLETEQRFQELLAQMAALRLETEQRFQELSAQMAGLVQENRLLVQAQQQLTQRLDVLTQRVDAMAIDLADVKGDSLERRYRERAPAYFGRLIRRIRALSSADVAALVDDAVDRGLLSEVEGEELTWADVVVRGKRREDNADVYLVAEVSWRVDGHDVERAARRAALFGRLGLPAQAVVAGKSLTDEAQRLVQLTQVVTLLDGQSSTS